MGDKKDKNAVTVFEDHSQGVLTSRDAWCYQFSKKGLKTKIQNMIHFFNHEVERYKSACSDLTKSEYPEVSNFICNNPTTISWSRAIKRDLERFIFRNYDSNSLTQSVYRPFTKSWIYFNRQFNEFVYQMPRIFPTATADNIVICVTGRGATKDFCAFICNTLPDYEMVSKGQCFPLKLYEKNSVQVESIKSSEKHADLFGNNQVKSISTDAEYTIKDGITDEGLAYFQSFYPTETINKEDVFYYIYGLLHSEDYKKRYADNLSKELPRIPCVRKASDFWAFSQAGRDLAELHINYESVEPYSVNFAGGELFMGDFSDADYRVEQMKFGKKNKETDKSTVIYNHKITMTHIPLDAYEYVVNGKPALEWVMERQAVTKHKESGIVNDANNWAIETMHDAAYPLKLFRRVITVSLKTMEIVKNLPRLDIAVSQA
ncbi:MAG: type ISP restriction/modification enzyme [Nitrosomonas sp.]